jgi:two-component system CheB/CheR fusion protein
MSGTPRSPPAAERPVSAGAEPWGKPDVTVVGIGTSAGGLAALKAFFHNVADDSGLAYVVIVHLSPEYESHLAGLLQPHSRMQVLQVTETVPLKPNCVYVIPPNANLSAIDTHLRLSALEERRGARAPIDHFFRTLAETHDGHAIGVVLTGTGSDGTLGVKEIKLRGGLTIAQDPNEAEFDSMPQSAISAGFVDLVLPVTSIPGAVLRWARTEPRLPALPADAESLSSDHELMLQRIFGQIRARTGRDFTRYKRSTVMRRIQRRMQLRYVEELDRYLAFLRQSPDEVRALSDDLLITVTSFFRDPAVFERLEKDVVPRLFDDKHAGDEVRVWCVGCATGEEVYSIAMLLLEKAAERDGLAPRVHIFATDLHERSLEIAREGFYPGDIASEVPLARLKRFFVEEAGGFRIRKEVRESVVFAPHNLLGDPPFSRLDLVVCRNLLIYLQRAVQADVLRIFHYALRPGGCLVLGTSETVDDAELFRSVDKQHPIYRRGRADRPETGLPLFPISRRAFGETGAAAAGAEAPLPYEQLHDELVSEFAPPSVLVGPDGQVVHLSELAGRFFEHPRGRMTANVGKLVRKELAVELVAAMHSARREKRPLRTKQIPVKFNGDTRPVVLHVRPALEAGNEGYQLVIFEELDTPAAPSESGGAGGVAAELALELEQTRQRLQGIIEEFETSQEEMRATNEELQSANEELRSTMEELETSREELQSMNEELQTVNQENRHKVEELAMLSSDLQNLFAATDIATLFLDRELRIQRITPKVDEIFNVRTTDRGRPLSDLTHRLTYPELRDDAETVLRQLAEIEREVPDDQGRWYLTHLRPYRSRDDRIAGVVITFVDITRRKTQEAEIQRLARTLEQRVQERTRQVRQLSTTLVRAEQRERRRLSETLHDELQQILYGVQLKLRLAREEMAAGRPAEQDLQLKQAEELLARCTRVTRQLSVDLNPPILKHEGVRSILTWLQGHMRELHNLGIEIEAADEIQIADGDARVLLFQVLRELLFNIAKHSGADKAKVTLNATDGEVKVVVADDGKGFDAGAVDGQPVSEASLGLTHVKERVSMLGGRMSVDSRPGDGARITVVVPLTARIGES